MNGFLGELFYAGFRPCRRGPFVSANVSRRAGAKARIIIPNPNDNPQHPKLTKTIPSKENLDPRLRMLGMTKKEHEPLGTVETMPKGKRPFPYPRAWKANPALVPAKVPRRSFPFIQSK